MNQIIRPNQISISTIFWFWLWAYAVGLPLLWGVRWWSGDLFLPVRLCNYLLPWLLLILLVGIVLALSANQKMLAVALVVPSLFIFLTYAQVLLPRPAETSTGLPLKIMSYNVWRENSDVTTIAQLIRSQTPDIVLLQEIHRGKIKALVAELEDMYPTKLYFCFEEQKQQAMMSHFPLRQLDVGSGKGRAQKVLASTPDGSIIVLNIHSLRRGWQHRHGQMSTLILDDIAEETTPLILAGDFNTTDQSQTYRLFDNLLNDAHRQSGWGFGFTYPTPAAKFLGGLSLPPLVRIDHIFYSKHFGSQGAKTLSDSGGSDHYPIIAELILKSERSDLLTSTYR